MRVWLGVIFLFCLCPARADIFKNDAAGTITSDLNNFFYERKAAELSPLSAFNFKDNLYAQIQTPMFNPDEVKILMNTIERSPLMLWQYSSPAGADLFKHYEITGQLRLDNFYRQAQEIQKNVGRDVDVLLDQAMMECLKRPKETNGSPDLMKTMVACANRRSAFAGLNFNEGSGFANVFDKIFNVWHLSKEKKERILAIVPQWKISADGYEMNAPSQRIGDMVHQNKKYYMDELERTLGQYRADKTVDADDLKDLSMPGLSLTEQMLRDWLMLTEDERVIVLDQLSVQMAYIKTTQEYALASEFLNRMVMHPSIAQGYKMMARQALAFVEREKESLNFYRREIDQYASVLNSIEGLSEKRRLEILKDLAAAHDNH